MKIFNQFVAYGLYVKMNTGKEGNKFYQVSLDQDGECGTLPMTEDAYLSIEKSFARFKPYQFQAEYNDSFKSFRITGIKAQG